MSLLRLWIPVLATALASCTSTSPPPQRPMPFHVALAPLAGAEIIDDYQGEGLRLRLEGDLIPLLNERLAEELGAPSFAELSLLESVDEAPDEDSSGLFWLERARANTQADLLLVCRLRHSTTLFESLNPVVHAAAPLSYLPGPQMWAVPDKRYNGNCYLTVDVYDLARYDQYVGTSTPGERRWYLTQTVPLSTLYTSYVNRAGWNLHYYFPALICPSILVGLEKDSLEREVNEKAIEVLAETLARQIRNRKFDVIRNHHDFNFFLATQRSRVEDLGNGRARVRITLNHKIGTNANVPVELRLEADHHDGEATLIDDWQVIRSALVGEGDYAGYLRYDFDTEVAISERTRCISLRVTAGDSPLVWRSYSLPVERGKDMDSN